MTKIKNIIAYPKDTVISDMDFVIGSDGDSIAKTTKNFFFGNIRDYLLSGLAPEVGGTLKYTEITNNTGAFTTPADLANSLDPSFTVLQYNIVVFTVNGNRYLLKLQNLAIGSVETPVTNDDFITIIGFSKIGDGQGVLKGYNETTKLHEYYSLKSDGNDISIDTDNIVIDPKEGVNLGEGEAIYKGLNATTKLHEFYNLKSNTQKIELIDNDVFIDIPETSTIPALYVNNLYVPTEADFLSGNTKGEGTLAKPFTDTVTAYVLGVPTITANTSIQNALDAYVGTGTRLNPELSGQQIKIQNNNSFYTFEGNLGYSRLNLYLEVTVVSTEIAYALDMDNSLHFNNEDSVIIDGNSNAIMQIQGLGFNNSGSDIITNNFSQTKTFTILDNVRIECFSNTDVLTRYIINSDISETGNNNDGGLTFDIRGFIVSKYQGVYNVKGKSKIHIYGSLQSGDLGSVVNTSLKAFNQEGGTVNFYSGSSISSGGQGGSARTNILTFTPNVLYTTNFSINNSLIEGTGVNLFNKLNSNDVSFNMVNSNSGTNLNITNVFETPALWLINFKNNNLSSGNIDLTKVDLTQGNNVSSVNFIGNNVVEVLVRHDDRASAIVAGLPLNSAYLKTSGVAYPTTSGWVRDIVLPA